MNDGTIIRETDEINFNSLDKEKINRFRITEDGSNIAVPFSSDNGVIRFTNLDLRQIQQLENGQKLTFEFKKDRGIFKLDSDSLDLYSNIMLKDEKNYYFIEFDQTGVFNINGDMLYTGLELNDGSTIEFRNQSPYTDVIQYKNGVSDIKMNGMTPINRNEKTLNYVIGYSKMHKDNEKEFNLYYEVIYDLINRYIMLDFKIQCNTDLACKIFMSYGGKLSRIPVQLHKGSPMQTKRVLGVIG
jgi:hypothetical protein